MSLSTPSAPCSPATPICASPFNAIACHEAGYLVYNLRSGQLHKLNTTASLLLEFCSTPRTPHDVEAWLQLIPGCDLAGWQQWLAQALTEQLLVTTTSETAPAVSEFSKTAQKLRDNGEIRAACICQEHVVTLQPQRAANWLALGELAHILGRRDQARQAYTEYLKLRPDNAEAAHILVALQDQAPPARAPDDCIRQLYSRFSGFYEKNMCEDLEYQGPSRLNEILEEALADTGNLDILELGCGTGLAAGYLRPRANRLTGIDLSQEMLDQAAKTGHYDQLQMAEITAFLGAGADLYHLIVACDTFIYFGDLSQVLVPAAARLHSHGWMVFTCELGEGDSFKLTDSGRYTHSEKHVRTVAASSGFAVAGLREGFLRKEYGEPVTGLMVALHKLN